MLCVTVCLSSDVDECVVCNCVVCPQMWTSVLCVTVCLSSDVDECVVCNCVVVCPQMWTSVLCVTVLFVLRCRRVCGDTRHL